MIDPSGCRNRARGRRRSRLAAVLLAPVLLASLLLVAACAGPRGGKPVDLSDPANVRFLERLAAIRAHAEDPARIAGYRAYIYDSGDINAVTGHDWIAFSSALVRSGDADLVDGVIAHEFAHVDLGHVQVKTVISLVTTGLLTVADAYLPGIGNANHLANPLVVNAFGREQELSADAHAVTILARLRAARGEDRPDVRATATLRHTLEVLRARYGDTGGGMTSAHPATSARIDALSDPP
jgi:Zn-dependent protease with chaperone function